MNDNAPDRKNYQSFRSTLNIGMGIIYLVLGGIAIVMKYFGNFSLDPIKAYLLGGLLIVYGAFRFWRGIQDLRLRRMEKLKNEANTIAKN